MNDIKIPATLVAEGLDLLNNNTVAIGLATVLNSDFDAENSVEEIDGIAIRLSSGSIYFLIDGTPSQGPLFRLEFDMGELVDAEVVLRDGEFIVKEGD